MNFMQPFERRALTEGEMVLGRWMFGDAIAWKRVRVLQLPALPFYAMVPFGRTIVYAKLKARRDFSVAASVEQGVFVHELAHVWQAARGMVLAFAKLRAIGSAAYRYEPRVGAILADYNIEAQAEIVRHLFGWRVGEPDPDAPAQDWLEEIWTRRSA